MNAIFALALMLSPCAGWRAMSHNVKLRELLQWHPSELAHCNNPAIFDVAQRFKSNLDRVQMGAALHMWMVGKATLYQDAATKVRMRASEEEASQHDFNTNSQAEIHAIADATEAKADTDDTVGFSLDNKAFNDIDFLLGHYGHPKPDGSKSDLLLGFDALFQATIIGAWTAFEVLCEDLHKTCRKSYSNCFSFTGEEKWQFTSRGDILNSYRKAFRPDYSDIRMAIKAKPVNAGALIRNILVHKAGLVDEFFLKPAKYIDSLKPFHCLNLDDPIELDGEIVRSIVEPLESCGYDLIIAVNTWINAKTPT